MKLVIPFSARVPLLASLVIAAGALVACGGGSSTGGSAPPGTIQGTVAKGAPLAGAQVQVSCKNGGATVVTDANGHYSATFFFDGPCAITATSGSIVLHSFAAGAGTYNVTALTELLLNYLAAQLGTTLSGLLNGIATNAAYQNALASSTVIANAEKGVASLIKQLYGVTLSTTDFLTVSFTPGQPADTDLETLMAEGAIQSDGEPVPTLVNSTIAAGAAAGHLGGNAGGATGGTGGTGGTGTGTQ